MIIPQGIVQGIVQFPYVLSEVQNLRLEPSKRIH